VVARLNAQELRPSFLITHRFALDDVGSALATLRGALPDLDSATTIVRPRGKVVVEIAEG
jgi:hypothetical protein